ncbi:CMP-N-acetylneuraminate-beta-1,4-galactoside alpha-2,3-sialyltransferase-like [Saccoglossus kowalevskii]|uniref:CMP-N-acetylneuraminate-beta-1,4-galactoside alpha-2,3-sialyltransferase-like n=1 Tax=Saccoglossus kowalevskii TaxID=10224 RepID=A0ABM0M9L2_SACKO|nr:PREDICTED: CMP-N-acetylneuraminate-beta-1,4-galactoside alpha-2,3-sialyltransferase-like [Saccoglossus kowalevskii]
MRYHILRWKYRSMLFMGLACSLIYLLMITNLVDQDQVHQRIASLVGDVDIALYKMRILMNSTEHVEIKVRHCERHHIQHKIKLVIPSFDSNETLFIQHGYNKIRDERFFSLLKLMETSGDNLGVIDDLLKMIPSTNKEDRFGNSCKRCIIVGNSGILRGRRLGSVIDSYDVVMRMNNAPTSHFNLDVGTKTSFRFIFPESAFFDAREYNLDSDVVLVAHKRSDYEWLYAVLKKVPLQGGSFWKKVSTNFPKSPENVRLLHPHIPILARDHLHIPIRASMGIVTLVFALHYCDHVDIVGFGHDPNMPYHYYSTRLVKKSPMIYGHNWDTEITYLKRLLTAGVIGNDLTGFIKRDN